MKKIITSDGSATFFSDTYQQTYHSKHGARHESEVVYLTNSGAKDRIMAKKETHVLEVGFGLGLNFLLTAELALKHACKITYTSFENELINLETYRSLEYKKQFPSNPWVDILDSLINEPKLINSSLISTVSLDLYIQDALTHNIHDKTQDVIYLDAFSPETNPDCWTKEFLTSLFRVLKPHGILSTYCVKGDVRRMMQEVGFYIEKRKGPPGKREVLVATKA